MPVRLVRNDGFRARVPVARDPLVIGSDPTADIVLGDEDVAPRHAKIAYVKGDHVLSALDGPVFLGESAVPFLPLRSGDRVSLVAPEASGGIVFTFENRMDDAFVPPGASWVEAWLAHDGSSDPEAGPARFGEGVPLESRPVERLRAVEHEGAKVVVKILGPLRDIASGDRALRLVMTLAGAPRRSLATVVDGGVARVDGTPVRWMATRFVEGAPATESIQSGGLDAADVADLLEPVAGGLAHLHARGVIHRDVAPANLIVGPWGATLIDYGQALLALDGAEGSPGVIGTPGYVAPEEVVEGGTRITPAVDVYGLAAVGYALLVGSPPASGDDLLETLSRSLASPPTPRALGLALPDALENAIMQGLDPDPAARPSARAFERACAFARVELGLGGRS